MKLTNFQIKLAWIVGIGSIICLWIAFPFIFKTLLSFYSFPEKFNEFGAFGDIYGSLNTLISSIALCAVAFSTWLQVTSLKETRKANKDQFILAREAHDEQIKESRNAIFANQFYSLLNYKREKFNSIVLECKFPIRSNGDQSVGALTILQILTTEFVKRLDSDPKYYDNHSELHIQKEFLKIGESLFNGPISPIISYFFIYKNLITLIAESYLDAKDRAIYFDIMCNSMFQEEQMVLFWISPVFPDLKRSIDNSRIFNQIWYDENLKNYGLKFHVPGSFRIQKWIEAFNN